MKALVSVVIPCYNVEMYIDECLGSVFNQTYASLEVFCVDDGSTDNTLSILRRYEAKGRIRLIEGEHAGAGAARNQGLAASTGQFVQFLDADDLLEPEKIGCQVGMLGEAGPDVPFLAGGCWRVTPDGQRTLVVPLHQDVWSALAERRLGITTANLWRRDALLAVNGWDEQLGSSQEVDLMFRLLQRGKGCCIETQPRTVVRLVPGSITRAGDITPRAKRFIEVRVRMLDFLRKEGILELEREQRVLESIVSGLRRLYPGDPRLAKTIARELLPKRFRPGTGRYGRVFSVLGFAHTERLYRLALKLRLTS